MPAEKEPSFLGFPSGKTRTVPIPETFFTELLPRIDHPGELRVTLACFYHLTRKTGSLRIVRRSELEADPALRAALSVQEIREGLHRAVARGTLLHIRVVEEGQEDDLYLLNTPRGRLAYEAIRQGGRPARLDLGESAVLVADRPNLFALYEQNIGLLTPLIAQELEEAARTYPAEWIEEAIRIAVSRNVRRWSYVRRILERWATEGRETGGTDEAHRRHVVESWKRLRRQGAP
ncbi:MAG: primosomal replication protein N [Thermoflexus sp.]|uniref:DnaD domain-containing protein n=1 Tax=Thermoflexus sp. TaxID=1969742 RepID=UPI00331D8A56